jgi:hypothetical protein
MAFKLIWNKEEIDEAKTREEAEYLKGEYQLAYKGIVRIKESE